MKKITVFLLLMLLAFQGVTAQEACHQQAYHRIEVGFVKTTHITFPAKVKYVDLGSNYLIAGKADETENVIRVKAAYKGFKEETNFSVICEDGSFYTFLVTYSDHPDTLYWEMQPVISVDKNRPLNKETIVLNDIEGESPVLFDMIVRSLYEANERCITHLGERKDKIEATLRGIYVHNDVLYFNLSMKNLSHISYDIDYVRFTVQDKKKLKRTASQVKPVEPARVFSGGRSGRINPKTAYRAIYAFQKFTISPEKILVVEIAEKKGGRNIRFTVRHSDIIAASSIKKITL